MVGVVLFMDFDRWKLFFLRKHKMLASFNMMIVPWFFPCKSSIVLGSGFIFLFVLVYGCPFDEVRHDDDNCSFVQDLITCIVFLSRWGVWHTPFILFSMVLSSICLDIGWKQERICFGFQLRQEKRVKRWCFELVHICIHFVLNLRLTHHVVALIILCFLLLFHLVYVVHVLLYIHI